MLAEHETLLRHQFAQARRKKPVKRAVKKRILKLKQNEISSIAPDSGVGPKDPDSDPLNDDLPPRNSLDQVPSVSEEELKDFLNVAGALSESEEEDDKLKSDIEDCRQNDPTLACAMDAKKASVARGSLPPPTPPPTSTVPPISTIKLKTVTSPSPTPVPEHMLPRSIHDREIFHSTITNMDLDCAGYAGEYYKYAARVKAAQKEKLDSRTTKSRSGPLVSTSHKIAAP